MKRRNENMHRGNEEWYECEEHYDLSLFIDESDSCRFLIKCGNCSEINCEEES